MIHNPFQVFFKSHILNFKFNAGTSRGILQTKKVFYIIIKKHDTTAIGEAAPLKGLSLDDRPDFEQVLLEYCIIVEKHLNDGKSTEEILAEIDPSLPSLKFGFEMAFKDYNNGGKKILFESNFTSGETPIPINGLIWMNTKAHMLNQVEQKLKAGYNCIKMKIGAINFEEECAILGHIRTRFGSKEIILRVDANGAFAPQNALEKLRKLAEYDLHSIEQPIASQQVKEMEILCKESPVPIALDEELIGKETEKEALLKTIKPAYIILKPTLLGGFKATDEWINTAKKHNIGWWVTSALESNIGLNAVAQYTASKNYIGHQGLGTGQLYHNNITAPLAIKNGYLHYQKLNKWDLTQIQE